MLRLWASSTSVFRQDGTARYGEIAIASDYVSVQAFCEGRPILVERDQVTSGRWKSYLAAPIWLESSGYLPVGVVVLGLLQDVLPKDAKKRQETLRILTLAGSALALPR